MLIHTTALVVVLTLALPTDASHFVPYAAPLLLDRHAIADADVPVVTRALTVVHMASSEDVDAWTASLRSCFPNPEAPAASASTQACLAVRAASPIVGAAEGLPLGVRQLAQEAVAIQSGNVRDANGCDKSGSQQQDPKRSIVEDGHYYCRTLRFSLSPYSL